MQKWQENKERLDKLEALVIKLSELVFVVVKARMKESPAYPFYPTMRLNEGTKLMKEIKELADNLGVVVEEPVEEPEPDGC